MRAKIIWAVLAVVVALVAWVLMTPPSVSGRVGMNRLVENAVTTAAAGQSDWRPSVTGADVNFGDRVATAAASRLEVSLLDRSMLTVGSNTRLDIDRFVYDPERDIVGVAVSVLRGAFRFVSNNRNSRPEAIAFRTPGSAIGIRGTIIEGVVGPEAVAFLAGIPGAPDLSAEADSAAVIILREGAIGIVVNGQSLVLDRPVQMVALTRTRLYPPFGVSDETTRRFEVLLPSRPGPAGPPTAPAAPVAPPVVEPVVEAQQPGVTRNPPRAAVPVSVAPRPLAPREPLGPVVSVPVAPPPVTQREPARTADPVAIVPQTPGDAAEATAPQPVPREPSGLETLFRQLLTRQPTPAGAEPPTQAVPSQPRARQPAEPQSQPPPTAAPRQR